VRVQHRHIVYVQGYDPRGLAQYYRMFRTELRKFDRLYQLTTTISRPQTAPDGERASWSIETKADDWQTRTSYDFLRFEDLIQRDLAAPILGTVLRAIWIYWRLVFRGTIARFWKANWRFATFITYPHVLLLAEALCSLGIALGIAAGMNAVGIPRVFGIVTAILVFILLGAWIVTGTGLSNYTAQGGFFPKGLWGMWVAVIVSIFSYLSIEMIAVAAGEAANPEQAIISAFRSTVVRLVVFYLLTLAIILAIAPWTESGKGESPFVTVMARSHVPFAAGVVNFVILVAALSAMNSQLYITTRMMFSPSGNEMKRHFVVVRWKT